jgi:hypothetical protein
VQPRCNRQSSIESSTDPLVTTLCHAVRSEDERAAEGGAAS